MDVNSQVIFVYWCGIVVFDWVNLFAIIFLIDVISISLYVPLDGGVADSKLDSVLDSWTVATDSDFCSIIWAGASTTGWSTFSTGPLILTCSKMSPFVMPFGPVATILFKSTL
jgi:hypothetical protein